MCVWCVVFVCGGLVCDACMVFGVDVVCFVYLVSTYVVCVVCMGCVVCEVFGECVWYV